MNALLAIVGCVCLVSGGYLDTPGAWVRGGAAIGLLWVRAERRI